MIYHNPMVLEEVVLFKNGRNRKYYNCECLLCGDSIQLDSLRVRKGQAKECPDCAQLSGISPERLTYTHLYNHYKSRCKKIGRDFRISLDTYIELVKRPCFYCGSEPKLNTTYREQAIASADKRGRGYNKKHVSKLVAFANGVDRKDSSLGYTEENSVPCCIICNVMKLNHTTEFFLAHARKIIAHNE